MRVPKILVIGGAALSRQVERVTSVLRPHPEVVSTSSLDEVSGIVAEQGPFDLVVGGPVAASDAGLGSLRSLRIQCPQTSLVLAFDAFPKGSLRQTIRTGAMDLLRLPVKDEVLLDAVEQALDVRWAAPLEIAAPRSPHERGSVLVVGSAAGGCGKTFFATNLAYYVQSLGRRACLLDFDLQFGELTTALRLKPRSTISDLLASDDGDASRLAARLEECVVHHESGIAVLAAPDAPAEADAIEPPDVTRVIEAAQTIYDVVVIDTSASLSEVVLSAIEAADQIFSIATLDLPSVRNLGVLLNTLHQLKVPSERVHLVLNKVEKDVGMDVPSVSRYFPQGFSAVVPYGREVNRSLNMGMPILAFAPRSDVSRALAAGLSHCLPTEVAEVDTKAGRRHRILGRLREKSA